MFYCELSLKIINDFEIVEHGSEQLSGLFLTEERTFGAAAEGSERSS